MALTDTQDYSARHGKMSKDSDVVYRVRNGKQQSYRMKESTKPATKAQKAHRQFFGKVNAVVNSIMNDPALQTEWDKRRKRYNKELASEPGAKPFTTVRSFVFFVISRQLSLSKEQTKQRKSRLKTLPRGVRLHMGHFSELTNGELYEILKARCAVFYTELHENRPELDDIDYHAIHIALHRKGGVIAYVRLYQGDEPALWFASRLLTLERGKGFGKYIMAQAAEEAKRQGAAELHIRVPAQDAPYFRSLGFKWTRESFVEADRKLIGMRKRL